MDGKKSHKVILIIVGLTILLSLPRFSHYVAPDSTRYVELASYFQGTLLKQELRSVYICCIHCFLLLSSNLDQEHIAGQLRHVNTHRGLSNSKLFLRSYD
jgi:hypothetical protein